MRLNSPGLRCSAAFSRRRITSLAAGMTRRGRLPAGDIEIGENQAAFFGAGRKEYFDQVGADRLWPRFGVRCGAPAAAIRMPSLPRIAAGAPGRPTACRRPTARVGASTASISPQRQLDILGFFLGAMGRFLHIEVGEDAQQRRADIDAVPACQIDQTVERGVRGGLRP